MRIKFGVVMDPLSKVKFHKDSSIAMLKAAQDKGWDIYWIDPLSLTSQQDVVFADIKRIKLLNNDNNYEILSEEKTSLESFDIIFMRKDPPFNMNYIYITYLLELVQRTGVLVLNDPQSLRDANEKCFITTFADCIPPTLISAKKAELYDFWKLHKNIVLKPLDGMGGKSIFIAFENNNNINVVLDLLTKDETTFITAQKYIPEINETGDKRILLFDGKPVPFALARIPGEQDPRGNLAVGGSGHIVELTTQDKIICEKLAPTLIEKKLIFVGIDVIGDYLTEINVTSPTCIKEIADETGIDVAGELITAIEKLL